MSNYKGWKQLERTHAKRMEGERLWRPDFGDSAPDGQSETDVWDCKYTIHSFAICALFFKCFKKYAEWAGDRRFHLLLSDKTTRANRSVGDLVVLRASDYAALVRKAGEA